MQVNVISETKQEFDGVVYYLCGNYFQKKGKRLHVTVWKHFNGDIPKGYHVHHKDGNRANNQIDNLELKLGNIHVSDHMHSPEMQAYAKRHIVDMQALAAEWHGSEAGRAWHGVHAKEMWEKRGNFKYICVECGCEFETPHIYGENQAKFCSAKCKTKNRVHSGVDNVEKTCVVCGKVFMTNKYYKGVCCSKDCVHKKRWMK